MNNIRYNKLAPLAMSGMLVLAAAFGMVRPVAAEDCVHAAPSATWISADTQTGYPNEARYYVMDIKNNDTAACASSTLTSTVPFTPTDVWAMSLPSGPVTVAPQAVVRTSVWVQAESFALPGTYPFTLTTVQNYGDATPDATMYSNITHHVVAYPPLPPGDTTRPNVSILYPTQGTDIVRNQTVTIQAAASDNVGVTQMFYRTNNGATTICSGDGTLMSCNWTPTKKGTHTLTVTAFDAAGNSRTASRLVYVR